ncbi:DUF1524 domain-containing protein [Streptomyces sp. NPDC026206]|uniref:GmrSD restriction endonuclease domain-containing protein n=1 Tax=Streptomyces sp. NPDC026206 TaxID=3157089 RepID=UPI0033E72C81
MRPEEIAMRGYRRLTVPSVITAALMLGGAALPGTAAGAAPRSGPAPAHVAGPTDYEEAACEGPAPGEGDVYSRPPRVGPPKGVLPKDPQGTHHKDPHGTHHKDPQGTPARDSAGMPHKDPAATPAKDPAGMPHKDPAAAPVKDPAGKPHEDPAAAPVKAPVGAHAQHRSLPLKWPRGIPERDEAVRMLEELDVKPFNSKGYDRSRFGSACWVRHGVDRCTTREIVLKFQSLVPATLDGKCRVVGGQWHSEYDNRIMADPVHMDVDHIVPLRHAWGSGANTWSPEKLQEFANDLTASPQLIVVSTWSNRRKGDKGPDKWLPQGGECPYSQAWVAVKDYYGLSVTRAEKAKLLQVLSTCGT